MAKLTSKVNTRSQEFAQNAESMQQLVDQLHERLAQVQQGGGDKSIERHRSRGKLFVRDRIEKLIDPGSAFLELSQFAVGKSTTITFQPPVSLPVLAGSTDLSA